MVLVWYGIVAFMLSTYIVLDGRNFGVGMVQWLVARERAERRQVVAAIGPMWLWHEVWLVSSGGVLFVAFPRLLASAFSGYYLAMFLIVWSAILRGISIEVGGHVDDGMWQSFWDAVLFLSSVLLAVLFGAALGNVIRGVPLHEDGTFHMAFFTNFKPYGDVGLLDWYTVSVALFSVLALAAHGATYLAQKTEGPVHDRAARLSRQLWTLALPAFLLVSFLTWRVRPELLGGLTGRPLAWLGILFCTGCAGALAYALHRRQEQRAFVSATVLLQGIVVTGAIALYPVMLWSTLDRGDTLTADKVSAPHQSLVTATVWWPLAAVLAVVYCSSIVRFYRGKVGPSRDGQGLY
ncbi:MAG TPA: cytochrome d ubiquinol oxidase subunit II [Labilithrix sp.]|nr:cytochrome d ubiquinol oxidase subunit II [Labilithrix sp.]